MHIRGKRVLAAAAAGLASIVGLAVTGPAAGAAVTVPAHPGAHHAAPAMPRLPRVKLRHVSVKSVKAAVPRAILWQRGRHVAPALGSGNLLYNGGPVAHTSRLYLLFWGTQWSSDPNGVESYLYNYTHGICSAGDNWVSVNFQYTDSSGAGPSCASGSAFQGWVQDVGGPAPANATQAQIAAEAVAGADYFGAVGTDAQIAVISPSGTHPDGFPNSGFCAWHSDTTDSAGNFVAYTNLPYVLDAGSGCGASFVQNQLDGFSIVEGHEFSETLTDPALNAWIDSSGAEIGDKCAWTGLFAQSTPWGTFAQQPLWDNSTGSCQP